jgi:hypothetical protein
MKKHREIEEIQKATGINVNSYKTIKRGRESLIIEVNDEWIFRFPRSSISQEKIQKRLNFLVSFSKVSPLKIPEPYYIESSFVGYKKIPGQPLSSSALEKLTKKERTNIARQLGLFLKTLHKKKSKNINFDTGYLVMRKEDYTTCPEAIAQYLNVNERKVLKDKLEVIKNN